ncbi:MAG: peptidoglycan DD-metalloendopeptidase family protein [Patescibacteria group bacterium]
MIKKLSNVNLMFIKNIFGIFIPVVLIIGVLVAYPRSAEASLGSFLSGFFKGDKVSAQVEEEGAFTNVSITAAPLLHAAVNIDPDPIKAEPDLLIVSGSALMAEAGPSSTLADLENDEKSTQISTYLVRQGDTIETIAEMFDVTVNTILWANNLSRATTLKEGQNLVILPISGIRHKIAKGETLETIVKKYNADLKEVLSFNDISGNAILSVGDTLMIPDAEFSAPVPKAGIATKVANTVSKIASVAENILTKPLKSYKRTQGIHGHNGVDLAASAGSPIYASAAGTVIVSASSGWNGGYGNYVVIAHANGIQTLYSHAQSVAVSVGDKVKQGQVIGKVGSSGKSTGPHLHFEVRGARNPF